MQFYSSFPRNEGLPQQADNADFADRRRSSGHRYCYLERAGGSGRLPIEGRESRIEAPGNGNVHNPTPCAAAQGGKATGGCRARQSPAKASAQNPLPDEPERPPSDRKSTLKIPPAGPFRQVGSAQDGG
jgi:hypothetical protein